MSSETLAYCDSPKRHRIAWASTKDGNPGIEYYEGMPSLKKGNSKPLKQLGIHGASLVWHSSEFPQGENMYGVIAYCQQCRATYFADLENLWFQRRARKTPITLRRAHT